MRNTKMMNKGMKALKKEAPEVAKKMGYMKGGMTKKMGYNKGGSVPCGASMTAERPMKKMK
jgi:hypothetical protein